MRIGVDVGGTNTDAALMDGGTVVASVKSPTTADIGSGVVAAIKNVLAGSGVSPGAIIGVMIGTTQFTNAIVERRRLVPVGIIRLALPATESLNPLIDWPKDLVEVIGRNVYMAKGGYEVDGREISPLDEQEIAGIARDIRAMGLRSIAISSVFAPLNNAQEERASEIIRAEYPDVRVTLSNEIGRVGLIERENVAVMNASLVELSIKVVGSFREALKEPLEPTLELELHGPTDRTVARRGARAAARGLHAALELPHQSEEEVGATAPTGIDRGASTGLSCLWRRGVCSAWPRAAHVARREAKALCGWVSTHRDDCYGLDQDIG